MKVFFLSAALAATANAFSPPSRNLGGAPLFQKSNTRSMALNSAIAALPSLPNPYKNLPWVTERERQREERRLQLENAALFRELGIPEDATYEEVAKKTAFLIEMAQGDIKKKIKIEIARDKIYQIRLNERIQGLGTETADAVRQSKFEKGDFLSMSDSIDDIIKPKKELKLPLISWIQSIIVEPDAAYRKRQLIIWGLSTLVCLINPPLTESFAKLNWLPAGGMMGYRGMPGLEQAEAGYNPFRGRRNKKHQVQAMGLAIAIWVMAKSLASWVVTNVPAMAASRSAEWFKFAIVQSILGVSVAYIQTYKEGEDSGELMI